MNNNLLRSILAYQMQHPPRLADATSDSRLPSGYAELNYVESAGNTYIDTGLKADLSDEYIVTWEPRSATNLPIFGDGTSKNDSNITLWVQSYNHANFNFGNGNSTTYVLEVAMPSDGLAGFHEYKHKNSTAEGWIDGVYKGHVTPQNFRNSVKMVLFASWRLNKVNSYGIGRMKDFIWNRDGVKVRHFVPAMRLSDSKIGMYDLCGSSSPKTGTPFYLPTTGTLTSGGIAIVEKDADVFLEIEVNNQNESKTLSVTFNSDLSARIWWGDGTMTDGSVKTHVYEHPGRYVIKMAGSTLKTSQNIFFTLDNVNLKRVHKLGMTRISSSMFNGNSSLTVAEDAMGYGLVTVGNNAFTNCSSMEVHSLPDSVQVIGNYAFKGTRIMLDRFPNDLSSVQESGFYECDGIRCRLKLNNLTSIGNNGFSYCTGITGLDAPKLSSIGNNAFRGCTGIAGSVTLPSAQSIGANAFYGCTGMTEMNLQVATAIGDNAFESCTGLERVNLPATLETMGKRVFNGCSSLGFVLIRNVTSVGEWLFHESGVSVVEIRSTNMTTLGRAAFRASNIVNCYIEAPNMTEISDSVFLDCRFLCNLYLNAPLLQSIGGGALGNTSALRNVYVPFSQSVFDMSSYVGSGVTVHYNYVFPTTSPGEFFQ